MTAPAVRIYIAGPISGLPGHNLPAFAAATEQLEAAGFDAVNPGRHGVTAGWTWPDYIRRALGELLGCEGVALLPGWENSRGATLEVHVAHALDMPVRDLAEWLRGAT